MNLPSVQSGDNSIGYYSNTLKEANSDVNCVFSRVQKLPQQTWQDKTVISSSLTPQAALLVPIVDLFACCVIGLKSINARKINVS